jgi:hypothetical protein
MDDDVGRILERLSPPGRCFFCWPKKSVKATRVIVVGVDRTKIPCCALCANAMGDTQIIRLVSSR